MSHWTDYGLPIPQVQGYGYSVAAGLMRTPFDTAKPNQSRLHTKNYHEIVATVFLTQAQLKYAEALIAAYGFSYFTMDLQSGYNPEAISLHSVRFMDDPTTSIVGYDLFKMDLPLEAQFIPYQWVLPSEVPDTLPWVVSNIPRYTGAQYKGMAYAATVSGVRIGTGVAGSTVSEVYIMLDGERTDVASNLVIPAGWTVIPIAPLAVPYGSTLDVAMSADNYCYVPEYYAYMDSVKGFEDWTDTWPNPTFSTNAFGIDIYFRFDNRIAQV